MIDLDRIEALAGKASRGPWHVDEDDRPGMSWNRHINSGPHTTVCFMAHSDGKEVERDEATAYLIAALSPEVAQALVAVVRAAQEAHAAMKDANDCVDNDGQAYQSQYAADKLAALRASLAPFTEAKGEE